MSWYVYILLCDNNSLYVGLTSNLQQRFKSHKSKHNLGTKEFKQIELVYSETYNTRLETEHREKQREKQIKGVHGECKCTC